MPALYFVVKYYSSVLFDKFFSLSKKVFDFMSYGKYNG